MVKIVMNPILWLVALLTPIPVIKQAKGFWIVSKPAGVGVHGDDSLVRLVRDQEQGRLLEGEDLHLIHRLDTPTSGLIVLGVGGEASGKIARGFQNRERDDQGLIKKIYVAICSRKPSKKMGTITGTIKKTRKGSYKLTREKAEPLSKTRFKDLGVGGGGRIILMRPMTGLMHQLRVTLNALGAPIVGDVRYGGADAGSNSSRLMLHTAGLMLSKDLGVID